MAEMKIEVSVMDMPKVKNTLERYKKIQKRRAWARKGKGTWRK